MFIVSLWYLTYTKMLAVEALDQTNDKGTLSTGNAALRKITNVEYWQCHCIQCTFT